MIAKRIHHVLCIFVRSQILAISSRYKSSFPSLLVECTREINAYQRANMRVSIVAMLDSRVTVVVASHPRLMRRFFFFFLFTVTCLFIFSFYILLSIGNRILSLLFHGLLVFRRCVVYS